jgi:membrane-associated phospholipid phosphatase
MRRALALALAVPLAASAAAPVELHGDPATDLAVTATAAAAVVASELAKPALAPERCRWCEPGPVDEAAREALVWRAPARARRASDVLAFGVLPAGVALHQLLAARHAGDAGEGLEDLLYVAQATAITAGLTQVAKYTAGRQRPLAYHAEPGRAHDPDDDLSFFSGHTSVAFALATSAGTVSSLRGYPSAPWVWAGGLGFAAAIGWLRMAGDAHWLTDVLAGAAVGTAVGIAVPRLAHGPKPGAASAAQPASVPPLLGFAAAF